jgi:hypothetical protein
MDEYQLLDLPTEELLQTVKEMHLFKCDANFRDIHDFDFEIESETYEDGIAKVAEKLATPPFYPTHVEYERYYKITLPIYNEGYWQNVEFSSRNGNRYCHDYESPYDIKQHPAFITKSAAVQAETTRLMQEQDRQIELRRKRSEMEIYEKVKKELESNGRERS